LIIRHFKAKDAAALFDYLASPRAPCFQDEKLHSIAEAQVEVARRANDPGLFAVCIKETDALIGHLFAENSGEPDRDTWSVGWHFNQRYEKQGYATESVTALFDYLFNEKGQGVCMPGSRIIIRLRKNYANACICDAKAALKSLSPFVSENGHKRYDDTYIYALLRTEWLK
jgi:RimJ/RimL family protein N-acetyltransferase